MQKLVRLLAGGLVGSAGMVFGARVLAGQLGKYVGRTIMTDRYEENLWELVSAANRAGVQTIVETNLRAEEGVSIGRPLGSPRKFTHFDGLMFSPVQLSEYPTPLHTPIDTTVVLGQRCQRPLRLDIPLMISGMAYGLALSEQAKYGLARGATLAGTAANTGEGPFLEQERSLASHLVIQYHRGPWTKQRAVLRQGDMVEIQLGQGGYGSVGHTTKASKVDSVLRKRLGLQKGQDAVVPSRMSDIVQPGGFQALVTRLREITQGVPIACKLALSDNIEEDIESCLAAGVDVLALDGAQGATKGSPPILADDFGLPTIVGLCRAVEYLETQGARDQVDIVISGGLSTPGHFLKALALGADAVYIGSIAMFAMTHTQVIHPLPFEPPTQILWNDGKFKDRFDWEEGGRSLARFLNSCVEEMCDGLRSLGKTSLADVSREDLVALDEQTASITNIHLAYAGNTSAEHLTPIRRRPLRTKAKR